MNSLVASYNLTHNEKKVMCESLWEIRVPSHFSSNIRKLVSMKDLSLCGYNYHDCHVLLMVFLPIAIRVIKPVGAGPGFVIWLFNISQGCKKKLATIVYCIIPIDADRSRLVVGRCHASCR